MSDAKSKANDLIEYLKLQDAFDTAHWSDVLLRTCQSTGVVFDLKDFVEKRQSPSTDDVSKGIGNTQTIHRDLTALKTFAQKNEECIPNLRALYLGSLGQSCLEVDEKIGFKEAVHKVSFPYEPSYRRKFFHG